MGTIPAPNVAQDAMQIAQAPQNAMAEYARVANLRQQTANLQQQQQEQAIAMQMQQRQLADQDALTKTIAQFDPSKNSINDIPKMITANGGSGQSALQAQAGLVQQRRNLAQLSDEQFAEETKKNDLIQGVHDEVSQAPPEQKQAIYQAGLQRLGAAGVDVSKEPPQYPGDDVFAQHLPAIRLRSAIIAEAEKDRQLTTEEQKAQTEQQKANAADWKDFPELGVSLNTRTGEQRTVGAAGGLMPKGMMDAKYVALQQKENAGQPLDPSDSAWKKAYEKFKTLVPQFNLNMQSQLLTPEAKEMAANLYQQTGQLPAGMRSPAMSAGVLNQAAGTTPGAVPNIAANKMSFGANQHSLDALQKNFDQVTAFENTAGKNLDTFLKTAKDVVDFGSPLVNMPLRKASALAGSADQAAYNAARTTALTEIAKVLNSSNASGVLSDSARGEVSQLIGPDASLKQIYSAANILKQDMANRHQAYQDQISEIKARQGGAGGPAKFTVPAGAPAAPKEDGHKLKMNGNVIAISKGGVWVAPQ